MADTVPHLPREVESRLAGLRLMAFDVDGVLTDGRLWYAEDGSEIKAFDARDGHGLKMLREAGLQLALITSRKSAIVERRARELGIHHCLQGIEDKLSGLRGILRSTNCREDEAGFMGDDLLDLPVLARVGFAATVPDAPEAVRARAHLVTRRAGGRGAVRELCEIILAAKGELAPMIARYLA
ncbi:MAG: phenylphosphate carboxylase subunit delta [Burkholderiales bacterium]|nr:phenylphosphate carboxylase subunit delta [Burkholderiales bacterium]